jgi:hypothetical protein
MENQEKVKQDFSQMSAKEFFKLQSRMWRHGNTETVLSRGRPKLSEEHKLETKKKYALKLKEERRLKRESKMVSVETQTN